MCLAGLALDVSRRFPLVVAANRDEFFHRPAARLGWWTPDGGSLPILGGRDLAAGGTWMGMTTEGRFALVTNVRGGGTPAGDGPSRGTIVPAWLEGQQASDRFWPRMALSGYAPFNLIAADFRRGECFWATNQQASGRRLERGVTVVSNAAEVDAPWPKVQMLKHRLENMLDEHEDELSVEALAGQLFAMLADRSQAPDEQLPHTGLDRDRERWLSPAFIRTPDGSYGTRCSTLVITERAAKHLTTHVFERTFTGGPGLALLRRATLRDWPPKYSSDEDAPGAGSERWAPVADSDLPEVPLEPPKKRRVRSLIRPLR
ncbi:NRDE family protein [Ideonella sp. DXS29W]|uniref:NRDE family protein n=1 Tax=Ideonella lacteola TaxID=2984193 RepID=A0ABU9BX38_9BURK